MADAEATEPSPTQGNAKADWRNPIALVIVFILAGLFIFVFTGMETPAGVKVTVTAIVTNAAGMPEVVVELKNEAAEIAISPQVQVAMGEEYGSTNSFIHHPNNIPASVPTARPAWSSQYLEDRVVKYHNVRDFTFLETEVRSSSGTNVTKGEVATLRFDRPSESFRLLIDCWQLSTNDTLRKRLERWNAWASQKFSAPVVFKDTSWAHLQVSTPVISSRGFTNEAMIRYIGKPFEFRP